MRSFGKSLNLTLLIAVLLCGGCSKLKPGESARPGSGETAFKPSGDARQDLQKAYQKLRTAYPYRLTETTTLTGEDGQTMPANTRVVEFAAEDRIHAKADDFESIEIGDKSYAKFGDKWVESKRQRASPAQIEQLIAETLKDSQALGVEKLNGSDCAVYSTRFEMPVGEHRATATSKIWIGLADGLVRQNDTEARAAGFVSKSRVVYEYNVNIKVEKPIP